MCAYTIDSVLFPLLRTCCHRSMQKLLFELVTLHGLAKLRLHTESTLNDLKNSVTRLGNRAAHHNCIIMLYSNHCMVSIPYHWGLEVPPLWYGLQGLNTIFNCIYGLPRMTHECDKTWHTEAGAVSYYKPPTQSSQVALPPSSPYLLKDWDFEEWQFCGSRLAYKLYCEVSC